MRLIIFSLLLSFTLKSQGPVDGYTKGKGNLDIGLGYSLDKGDRFYAGSESINASRSIAAYTFFGIYGITDKLDIQLNIPYINMNKGNETNFQDGSIYIKYKILKNDNKLGNFNLLGAAGYYTPLSNYETGGGNAIGQLNNTLDSRLILQQNFNSGLFVSVQGGYFLKSTPTPNAYLTSLKVGYASGKIYADAWFEFQSAFGGTDYRGIGDLAPNVETGGFKGLGYAYTKIGGTVYYPINSFLGVYVGGAYTLNGRNIVKGTRISAGAVFKLLKNNKF
jgi:hypothetical protein